MVDLKPVERIYEEPQHGGGKGQRPPIEVAHSQSLDKLGMNLNSR